MSRPFAAIVLDHRHRAGTCHIDASGEPLTYSRNFLADVCTASRRRMTTC
jgi:hypothetical protein